MGPHGLKDLGDLDVLHIYHSFFTCVFCLIFMIALGNFVPGGMTRAPGVHDVDDLHELSDVSTIYTLHQFCLERQVCTLSFIPVVRQGGSC